MSWINNIHTFEQKVEAFFVGKVINDALISELENRAARARKDLDTARNKYNSMHLTRTQQAKLQSTAEHHEYCQMVLAEANERRKNNQREL